MRDDDTGSLTSFEMAAAEFKAKADVACLSGEEFYKLYYETFDKRRNILAKLYLDTATLVWNGNACKGVDQVAKFFEQLPASHFRVESLDCQPIIQEATNNQTSILVTINGTVKFDGHDHIKAFHQSFILTAQGNNWKIASDCFRFRE